jgi:hypothetical protein
MKGTGRREEPFSGLRASRMAKTTGRWSLIGEAGHVRTLGNRNRTSAAAFLPRQRADGRDPIASNCGLRQRFDGLLIRRSFHCDKPSTVGIVP